MPRYIDKDALLNKMEEQYEDFEKFYGKYHDCVMGFSDAMQLLEDEPEINEQGILRGHWIGKPRDIAIDVAQKCWRTNNGKIY